MLSRRRKRQAPIPTEREEQVALARYLDALRVRWCHVPNGGNRSAITGARLKAEGVKAGVPDVLVFTRPPAHPEKRGVAIELKRQKHGRLSADQRAWLTGLREDGWLTAMCAGEREAVAFLQRCGYDRAFRRTR